MEVKDVTFKEALVKAMQRGWPSVNETEIDVIKSVVAEFSHSINLAMSSNQLSYHDVLYRGILVGLEVSRTATVLDDMHKEFIEKITEGDPFGDV